VVLRLNVPSGRVVPLSVLAGVALSAAVGLGIAEAGPATQPPDTLALTEVKPGMKGYGLTVFSGTEPEKFDVEVISVLDNFRPNQSLILIKTPNHPRLDVAHTVAGMSGSPIYLNGKIVGAYAYGWLFGAEAIAGVTPISSMLEEQHRVIPSALAPAGGSPVAIGMPSSWGNAGSARLAAALAPDSARTYRGEPARYDLGAHAQQLASGTRSSREAGVPGLAPASTPVMLGGLGDDSMRVANDLLAPMGLIPVQAGGGGGTVEPGAPTAYKNGSAIAVQLVRGDISATGMGTVTRVDGDKLLAFGHPMMNGGVSNMPTAIGRVHWILASTNRSFKIGEPIRPLGALVNDRQAAIVVDTKAVAPTFPVSIKVRGVEGAPKSVWNAEVAHDRFMAPMLTALAVGNSLESTTAERFEMTWRARSEVDIAGYGTIVLHDFGSGAGSPINRDDFARSRLVRAVGSLLNNPWESVKIDAVRVDVAVTFEQEVSKIRGAKLLESEIDAGESAHVRLELQPYKGETVFKTIEIPIPKRLAGETVNVRLRPGHEVERDLPTPESVSELVYNLPRLDYPPESLIAEVQLSGEAGAAFRGVVAENLPPSAVDTLRSTADSTAPELFKATARTVIPMGRFVVGSDGVSVDVRPVMK
jgi:hypothetical protein